MFKRATNRKISVCDDARVSMQWGPIQNIIPNPIFRSNDLKIKYTRDV